MDNLSAGGALADFRGTKSMGVSNAYGRQSISRPMRIVAPIQKNPASKAKFAEKQIVLRGNFTPFMSKSFEI